MTTTRAYLFLLLFFATCTAGLAQHRIAPDIQNFKPADYGAHNQNWDFVQDHRGIIYVANGDGVLEYDGQHWKLIKTSVQSTALSLSTDNEGRVYVGGIGDLGVLRPNAQNEVSFHSFLPLLPDSIQSSLGNVWNTHVVGDEVFFRTSQHLFVFQGDDVEIYPSKGGYHKSWVIDGKLWIQDTGHGFYEYHQGEFKRIDDLQSLTWKGVNAIVPADQKKYIIITSDTALLKYDRGAQTVVPFAAQYFDWFMQARVYCGVKLADGSIALGTYKEGVVILDQYGKMVQKLSRREGLLSEDLNALFYDANYQLWCGLNSGISKVADQSPLSTLEEGQGYSGVINGVMVKGGVVCFGTTQTVWTMKEPQFTADTLDRLITPERNINAQTFQMIPAKEGGILAATAQGLYHLQGDQISSLHAQYARVITDVRGTENIVAFSGRNHLYVLQKNGQEWDVLGSVETLPDEALSLRHDPTRTDSMVFWMGMFSYGITKVAFANDFSSSTITNYGQEQGVPDRWTQVFEVDGALCFGTDSHGIYRFDEQQNRIVSDSIRFPMLKDQSIFILEQMSDGSLLLDATGAIWRLIPSAGTYLIDSISFAPLSIGEVNVITEDTATGVVWLGGTSGLASFDPLRNGAQEQPFVVSVRKVMLGLDSLLFNGNYVAQGHLVNDQTSGFMPVVDYAHNSFRFDFTSSCSHYPALVEYSYRLDGKDNAWSTWSSGNFAQFADLQEGEYTFHLRARNVFLKTANTSFQFTVLPPWYRTWWAYLLFGVLGGAMIVVLYKLREARKVKRHNEYLEEEVRVRTEEIRQQRDDIADQKTIIERKNKDIMDSINYARQIQEAILPSQELLDEKLPEHFVLFKPRDVVSGDFYWFHTKGDSCYLAVADCTGHGVPGAFLSMMCHNLLSEAIIERDLDDPGEILSTVNRNLQARLKQDDGRRRKLRDGMDLSFCRLDRQNEKPVLHYAGAKNPLVVLRQGELIEYRADRRAIGGITAPDFAFTTHQMNLQKDDTFFLYSDGFQDQFGGAEGKKYLVKRFKTLLQKIGHQSPTAIKQQLNEELITWQGDLEQLDDICVVGVRIV